MLKIIKESADRALVMPIVYNVFEKLMEELPKRFDIKWYAWQIVNTKTLYFLEFYLHGKLVRISFDMHHFSPDYEAEQMMKMNLTNVEISSVAHGRLSSVHKASIFVDGKQIPFICYEHCIVERKHNNFYYPDTKNLDAVVNLVCAVLEGKQDVKGLNYFDSIEAVPMPQEAQVKHDLKSGLHSLSNALSGTGFTVEKNENTLTATRHRERPLFFTKAVFTVNFDELERVYHVDMSLNHNSMESGAIGFSATIQHKNVHANDLSILAYRLTYGKEYTLK